MPPFVVTDDADLSAAYEAMTPTQQNAFITLAKATAEGRGVREAAIAFLKARGIKAPAIVADRILHEADGVA